MTNGEIFSCFRCNYPQMASAVNDYRPLDIEGNSERQGITLYLKNGDIILYLPKAADNRKERRQYIFFDKSLDAMTEEIAASDRACEFCNNNHAHILVCNKECKRGIYEFLAKQVAE